ncbi:MAG: metallophosphoesterase [Candidatus Korarchaeum sp.]|jgi:Icc-related predicted phosphoesterase|nr:metallophosphoesterase [Candidatus Korarchaeum sp.]
MTVRMFFAADIHGNTVVWRKWLNAVNVYKANVIILAGDLTGKAIVPIFDKGDYYEAEIIGRKYTAKSKEELQELMDRIESFSYYYVVLTPQQAQEIAADPKKQEELFKELMVERIRKWLDLLIEKVDVKSVTSIVMPGNDDERYIDETIKSYEDRGIIYPLDKTVELNYGYQIISHEYVNPTPWNTPREAPEDKLEKILREKIERSGVKDFSKALFNFHCPPYNTKLDLAPKLDKNLKPVYVGGKPVLVHVGSKSVRKLIEQYQPLMGLHGHIHESYASDKVGRTIVVNPGSEYSEGLLRGFVIELEPDGLKNYWKIEG